MVESEPGDSTGEIYWGEDVTTTPPEKGSDWDVLENLTQIEEFLNRNLIDSIQSKFTSTL